MKTISRLLGTLCACLCILSVNSQFTSDLPIVKINTSGANIPDEPKISGTLSILHDENNLPNSSTAAGNIYVGNCAVETRGNSTQGFDKKTYSFELRNGMDQDTSVNLLGMGKEEDWILHAMVIDKTQLRIPYSFYLSQRMGHYASKWRFVELELNGDYRGLYILTEKIKRDDDRVDISKLKDTDIAGDEVTGGYILRIDWLDYTPQGFSSSYNAQGGDPMFFQWYYPKAANIQPAQAQYISDWMNEFENALFSPNFYNSQGNRYSTYIDINTFVDFLIINEFSKNSDGYKLSSYLHKDRDSKGGKMNAGPIWDFDQTYGMSTVCSNNDHTGWTYLQNQPACEDLESMPMWWQEFMSDDVFKNRLKCRWEMFRQSFLHKDSVNLWIDNHQAMIADPINRNFNRWPNVIGEPIWAEPYPIPATYAEEIQYMKDWMSNRIDWMDANIPGDCSQDVTAIEPVASEGFSITPNPAADIVKINGLDPTSDTPISVYDVMGKLLMVSATNTINVSHLPTGVYYVRASDQTKKLLVDR